MKKLLTLLMLVCGLGLANLEAQQFNAVASLTGTTPSQVWNVQNTGIAYWGFSYTQSGTVSGCTASVKTSQDNITYTSVTGLNAITCTSVGQTISSTVTPGNFIELVPSITGGGTVNFVLYGYILNPMVAGGGASNATIVAPLGSQLSAASVSVVIASDQAAVLVKQNTAANFNATVVGTGTFLVQSQESGTWTVQPGNTANTTPWLSTINQGGNSATVSAGGALKVDGSAVTQPVSGTVTTTPPANASTNIAQVNGATIATGHGTAAGTVRVELPTDGTGVVGLNAGTNLVGKFGIDQTTPGTTNAVNINNSGDPCANPNVAKSSAFVTISTVTTTQVIGLVSNQKIYVCGYHLSSLGTTTPTIQFVTGTAANCSSGQANLTGTMQVNTTPTQMMMAAGSTLFVSALSAEVCIISAGATNVTGGYITYVQQ